MDQGDRNRLGTLALVLGAVATLAVSAFAVGAAISSDDDSGAAESDQSVPAASAPAVGTEPAGTAAAGTSPPVTATARFDVDISGFRFNPEAAVVSVGTEVVWTNNDGDGHSIVSDDGAFTNSDVFGEGETYAFVFTTPGTYAYTCGVHTNMHGTITVEA